MISKTPCISLQLLERTMYVDPSSDLNNAVRGTIQLNFPKSTTIQSISVVFDGIIESKGTRGSFSRKRPITRERLILYPPEDHCRALVLSSGPTQFGFEMQIPSKLPESIHCQDVKVRYSVTAIVHYRSASFLRALSTGTDKKRLHIARVPSANDLLLSDAASHARFIKYKWLHYQVALNQKTVALGSDLPITFRFVPQQENVTVEYVGIQLLERRNITSQHIGNSIQAVFPARSNKTSLPCEPLKEEWEGTINYTIPKNASIVHSTQAYSDFSVSHTLLVNISLSIQAKKGRLQTKSRIQKMLSFQTQIDLLDPVLSKSDTLKLPSYDSPPPFDESAPHYIVFPEYDRKFVDPPAYTDVCC